MAILTVQIPDTEILTLSSIIEQIAGTVIKVSTEEDLHASDCILHKDDLYIKNKLDVNIQSTHLWDD